MSPVQVEVILEVDKPEQGRAFEEWCRAVGLDLDALQNEGCGCCVDIYTFSASRAAVSDLEARLRERGTGITYLSEPS